MNGATSSGAQRAANGPPTPPRSVNGASTVEDEGLANQVAQVAALTEQVTDAGMASASHFHTAFFAAHVVGGALYDYAPSLRKRMSNNRSMPSARCLDPERHHCFQVETCMSIGT